MKIDSKLNLVVEIESETGTLFVHSTPIAREVFEKYFLVISKAYASIISEGLSFVSGPRVAALLLKKIAVDRGAWEGSDGVEVGLMAEIRRLSNVVMPTTSGWKTVPFQDAIDKQMISLDDIAEVEGLICFFICVSAMARRTEVAAILEKMSLWGSQTTSLTSSIFADSLPKPIETEISQPVENTLSALS